MMAVSSTVAGDHLVYGKNAMVKFLVVGILFLSVSAWQPSVADDGIRIFGNPDCTAWTKIRKKRRSDLKNIYEWWVSGFVSGLVMAEASNVLAGIDVDAIYEAVDNYCKRYPNKDVMSASYLYFQAVKQ